jgi:hypothetical protein
MFEREGLGCQINVCLILPVFYCCQIVTKTPYSLKPREIALEQGRLVGHHTAWIVVRREGSFMIRLVNLVFFVGCALLVAHYYGLGSTIELLAVVAVAGGLMRVLSGKRIN